MRLSVAGGGSWATRGLQPSTDPISRCPSELFLGNRFDRVNLRSWRLRDRPNNHGRVLILLILLDDGRTG